MDSLLSRIDARFVTPVRVGDVVEARVTIAEVHTDGRIEATLAAEVDGRLVLRGSAEVRPAMHAAHQATELTA